MTAFAKVFGVILVVFSTSAYGIMLSRDLRSRLNELKEVKKIMFLLKGEIGFGRTPIFEAAGNISDRCRTLFKDILNTFASMEQEARIKNISEIWHDVFENGLKSSHLALQEKERLMSVGDIMGLMDTATQQTAIDAYLTEIEESITSLEKALPVKTRLYNSLGIMLGIIITIIIV
ncbi:MAG: stage III sporulation protein AB [Butyrivibrio sp.]